jgi:hypothetical protein
MLLGVPACLTNSMIKYMEIKIACLFRERLTNEAVKRYMSGNTFYSVANLDGRLGNADQCLTNDIEKFCQHLSHLCVCLPPPPLLLLLPPPPPLPPPLPPPPPHASPSALQILPNQQAHP